MVYWMHWCLGISYLGNQELLSSVCAMSQQPRSWVSHFTLLGFQLLVCEMSELQ